MSGMAMASSNVHPATVALLKLAPCISFIRHATEICTWSTAHWHRSWLALASWWLACLVLDSVLRRFLPVLVLALLVMRAPPSPPPLVTERTLQSAIADLSVIQSILPEALPAPSLSPAQAFRAAALLTVPYLLLSFAVSFRVLLALAGSLLLTWRAPWVVLIRATLWRSAYFRSSAYYLSAVLINSPLPSPITSPQPTTLSTEHPQSIRFLFTIYENQRWWMGLDWTAALLPAERPSWSSATFQPMAPPNAFALPEDTTLYLPDPKGRSLKRTATWRWEEPDWRVLVHQDGSPVSRVQRPLSTIKDDLQTNTLRLKAAGSLKDAQPALSKNVSDGLPLSEDLLGDPNTNEIVTDADGWVYADNKWENPTSRSGMRKFTRYRRWTRIAIVFEIVEPTSPGDVGIDKHDLAPPPVKPTSEATHEHNPEAILIQENVPESPLRQRLQNALKSAALP